MTKHCDGDLRVARNVEEFCDAWRWHIQQLGVLALKANVTFEDWSEVSKRLDGWLNDARVALIAERDCE